MLLEGFANCSAPLDTPKPYLTQKKVASILLSANDYKHRRGIEYGTENNSPDVLITLVNCW